MGARVYRRMGEGLGAGGHSTRRCRINARSARGVPASEIIFGFWSAARAAGAARAFDAPDRRANRHACHREIRYIANGCEEFLGRRRGPRSHSVCQPGTGWADHLRTRTSRNPPRKQQPSWNLPPPNARAARQFRDGAVFGHDFCGSLWTRRSRTQPRCTDDHARRNRLPAWRRSSGENPDGEATGACVQRTKPLSRAKTLRDISGRAPRCWITSAATNPPRRAAVR
jgi:hypothetical protein